MYLSRKQISALEIAVEAIEHYNSGLMNEEQSEACDTIVEMLHSGRRAVQKANNHYRRKKEVHSR